MVVRAELKQFIDNEISGEESCAGVADELQQLKDGCHAGHLGVAKLAGQEAAALEAHLQGLVSGSNGDVIITRNVIRIRLCILMFYYEVFNGNQIIFTEMALNQL